MDSVILCGSHARGDATALSDYDMLVPVSLWLIPLMLPVLKATERKLSEELKAEVTLNPLPKFRLHHATGNLFMLKLKKEAVTLYGKDYLSALNPGEAADIRLDWYLSYIFSAMKELGQGIDVRYFNETGSINSTEWEKLSYRSAKALLYCGELILLQQGSYEVTKTDMVARLAAVRHPLMTDDFLADLRIALSIWTDKAGQPPGPLQFWLRTRSHLLQLMGFLLANPDENTLSDAYLALRRRKVLKNLQYLALVLLSRRELQWRSLVSRLTVEDRLRLALFYLLTSINEKGEIRRESLEKCYRYLKGYSNIAYSESPAVLWQNLKATIYGYWSHACVLTGM